MQTIRIRKSYFFFLYGTSMQWLHQSFQHKFSPVIHYIGKQRRCLSFITFKTCSNLYVVYLGYLKLTQASEEQMTGWSERWRKRHETSYSYPYVAVWVNRISRCCIWFENDTYSVSQSVSGSLNKKQRFSARNTYKTFQYKWSVPPVYYVLWRYSPFRA